MKYSIYETYLDSIKKTSKGRKKLKELWGKEVTYADFTLDAVAAINSQSNGRVNVEATSVVLTEKSWVESGAPVIFLENDELTNNLYQADYDFCNGATIDPPFKHFALSLPPSTVIDGYEVRSCLVSMVSLREYLTSFGDLVGDSYLADIGEAVGMFVNLDDIQVSVYFRDSEGVMHQSVKVLSEDVDFSDGNENCTDALLKIAVTLCLYNSATFGKNLVSGYPTSSVKMPKGKNKTSYQGILAKPKENNCGNDQKRKVSRKIKYRIPYFRNLRADRFYQNEFANVPRGSRWVWVNGVDVDARMNTLLK